MKKNCLLIFSLCIASAMFASDTLNVMFYNIYRFPSANPSARELLLNEVLSDHHPDILMVCELENEAGADSILNRSFVHNRHRDSFARATFIYNQSAIDDSLQQMVYYNTRKFTLLDQQVYPTTVRDINRYTLLLNTADAATDSVIFELFVTHLKSSTGTANVQARYAMVDTMVNVLNSIPTSRVVLFGGDMNFYRSTELGYQHIIDTTRNHVLVDPIDALNGAWQDKEEYAYAHTQATRVSGVGFGLYGARGGVDDRFDFIFVSEAVKNAVHPQVSFVPGSYEAVGNNGNCLNKAVNDTSCVGVYDLRLRQNLHDMSDHLPVSLKLYTTKDIAPIVPDSLEDPTNILPFELAPHGALEIVGSNQVAHVLYVKYTGARKEVAVPLYFYNQMGKSMQAPIFVRSNEIITIDVSAWPSGLYLMGADGLQTKKFAKY